MLYPAARLEVDKSFGIESTQLEEFGYDADMEYR